jgi:hypothetical protein
MPIFMQYDGIKGNVTSTGNGGIWKTTNFLAGGTANTRGGVHVAVGDLDYSAPGNRVEISRISFPNSPIGLDFVDGADANAANKAGMMFEAQRSGGTFTLTFNGQVTGAATTIRAMNNLRQTAISGAMIPLIEICVGNRGNSNRAG